MAMNLRLGPDAADGVRREALRTGRSQQDVIREAVDRLLGRASADAQRGDLAELIATGLVRPPRAPYRPVTKRVDLPPGVGSEDLLDRRDRI